MTKDSDNDSNVNSKIASKESYDDHDLGTALKVLAKLKTKKPKYFSRTEFIERIYNVITDLEEKGFFPKEIAEELSTAKLNISEEDLQDFIDIKNGNVSGNGKKEKEKEKRTYNKSNKKKQADAGNPAEQLSETPNEMAPSFEGLSALNSPNNSADQTPLSNTDATPASALLGVSTETALGTEMPNANTSISPVDRIGANLKSEFNE